MNENKPFFLIILILIAASLACSISGISKQARSLEQTAQALKTEIGGFATVGGSIITTAQALGTQHPGVIETAKGFATQGAPIIGTIQAVATENPGLVQTAQAFIEQELPTGEPPSDIPIFDPNMAENYYGTSQYIFYISPTEYTQVLDFYKTQMLNNGWQYVESDSHEFTNAAQLNYSKDSRQATINLSNNPFNNSTVVIIGIITQ